MYAVMDVGMYIYISPHFPEGKAVPMVSVSSAVIEQRLK